MLGAATLCMPHDATMCTSVPITLNTLPAERNLSVASKDPNCSCSSACWHSDLTLFPENHNKPVAVTAEFALASGAEGSPLRPGSIMRHETDTDPLSACRPLRKRPYYVDPKQGPCSDACWRSDPRSYPEAAAAAVRPDAGLAGSAQPAAGEGSIVDFDAAPAPGIEQERPAGSSAPDGAAADSGPAAQAAVAAQHSLAGRQRTMRCKGDCSHLLPCHCKFWLLHCRCSGKRDSR